MSDLIINIRVLSWHLQVSRRLKVRIVCNAWHGRWRYPAGRFAVYQFWPFRK